MKKKQEIIISIRKGQSQRSVAKELGISRTTVRKYVDEYNLEKQGAGEMGVVNPPKYKSGGRKKKVLTEEVTTYIDNCLEENKIKRSRGNKKQCMAGTDIHDGLLRKGISISYPTVVKYIRKQKLRGNEVFIKQKYQPGSNSEFDWGEVKIIIKGILKRYLIAVFTSGFSNHRWAKLYVRQDTPSLLQAHVEYFDLIQGVPKEIVYDNMRTAVRLCTIKQSEKIATDDLLKISAYYQFNYRFCNIAKGNEKGHVEKSVEFIRRKAFSPRDTFDSLEQANEYLQAKVDELNQKSASGKTQSIDEELKEEQKYYYPLPIVPYDYAIINSYKIDKYHTISVDTNHYSIPESIHSQRVNVKIYPDKIHIYAEQGNTYFVHPRRHAKHEWIINIDHYWLSFVKKPGALGGSQALSQASAELKELFQQHYVDLPRVFIEIMLYCKSNEITLEVLKAITIECKQKCINSPITKDKIILMLKTQNSKVEQLNTIKTSDTIGSMSDNISNYCTELLKQTQQYLQSF